jgi:hypothetical protein
MRVHAELRAALHYCALLYPTVARWVQVFEGVQLCTLLTVTCISLAIIEKCLDEDRNWTVKELANAYRRLWVHSASFFTTGLKSAQFFIQV